MFEVRPERLVVVVGTGTEVGKTWVAAAALARLRAAGRIVAARKPAQSFEAGDTRTDAQVLGQATGEDPTDVCPAHRWYERALAPPMAADVLGRPPFSLTDLHDEIRWPEGVEIGLVETAGGVRSPLAGDDGDAVALTASLMPDVVVVVADAGLGSINAVRLTVAALDPVLETREDTALVVVLNRYDPADDLHRRNRAWLADHDALDAVVSVDDLVARLLEA
jgi:dethiobiotin synthetase